MLKRSLTGAAALGLVASLALAGCSAGTGTGTAASPAPTTGGTFHVALIAGITGAVAPSAADVTLGLKTAAKLINADGGIQGKKVVIQVLDDKSDPTQAVTQLQSLVSSGTTPDLVWPGLGSSETLALLPVLTADKILSMANTTSEEINEPDQYPFHFGISPTNADSYAIIGNQLKAKKVKKLGLLVPSSAYGDSLIQALTAIASKSGAKIIDTERFDPTSVDYTAAYQRLLASKPDAVFSDSIGGETIGHLFDARQKAGGLSVPLFAGNGAGSAVPETVASPETLANCTLPVYGFTVKGESDAKIAKLMKPLAAAVAAHGQTTSVYAAGYAFDLLRTIALAGTKAKSTSAEDMAKALETMKIPADYSLEYPDGYAYSSTTHFPTVAGAARTMIPCSSTTTAGFWNTK